MSWCDTVIWVSLGAWAVLGCGKGKLLVTDTEGRSFAVDCQAPDRVCFLEQKSGLSSKSTQPMLRAEGRLVGVCDGLEPMHLGSCRALVCEADSQCPSGVGSATGTCIGSLCVEPSHVLRTEDAVMLCLSGTGLGHERADQVERYALGVNCGDPCLIPAPCRKP